MEKQVCYRAIGERAVVSIVSVYLEIWMAKPSLGCVQGVGAEEEAEVL